MGDVPKELLVEEVRELTDILLNEGEDGECAGVLAVPPGRLVHVEFDPQEKSIR